VRDENKGDGVIEKLDVMREQIQVRYGNGEIDKTSLTEFREISNWRPEMPRNECICTCGKKQSAPVYQVERFEETYEPLPEEPGGERVTLLAGGGLGLQSSEGKGDIEVGTSMDVPHSKSKKKRRRNKHGKKSEGGEIQVSQQAAKPEPQARPPQRTSPAKPQRQAPPPKQPAASPPVQKSDIAAQPSAVEGQQKKKHRRGHGRGRHGQTKPPEA
jgi:hypothetical protein